MTRIYLDILDMMYLKYLTLLLYLAVSIAKGDKPRGSLGALHVLEFLAVGS